MRTLNDLNRKVIGKRTKEKGVTLIALVITIIVLIILVVISVNMMIGDNGIVSRAERAKEHQANAEADDLERSQTLANIVQDKIEGKSEQPEKPENIDPETGWNLDKVDRITSEDGKIVPVPKGYVASTVAGEKSV